MLDTTAVGKLAALCAAHVRHGMRNSPWHDIIKVVMQAASDLEELPCSSVMQHARTPHQYQQPMPLTTGWMDVYVTGYKPGARTPTGSSRCRHGTVTH